jgi:hypothetical protein
VAGFTAGRRLAVAVVTPVSEIGKVPGGDDGAVEEVAEHLKQLRALLGGFVPVGCGGRGLPDLADGP